MPRVKKNLLTKKQKYELQEAALAKRRVISDDGVFETYDCRHCMTPEELLENQKKKDAKVYDVFGKLIPWQDRVIYIILDYDMSMDRGLPLDHIVEWIQTVQIRFYPDQEKEMRRLDREKQKALKAAREKRKVIMK